MVLNSIRSLNFNDKKAYAKTYRSQRELAFEKIDDSHYVIGEKDKRHRLIEGNDERNEEQGGKPHAQYDGVVVQARRSIHVSDYLPRSIDNSVVSTETIYVRYDQSVRKGTTSKVRNYAQTRPRLRASMLSKSTGHTLIYR